MNSVAKRQRQAWTAERLRVEAGVPLDWSPLDGAELPEYIPEFWTGPHVGLRMVEAFKCLSNLPDRNRVGGRAGYWPDYWPEWQDLMAQEESDLAVKDERAKEHNRARVMPSAQDISRMEIVISWGARYLLPIDAVLVQKVAFFRSQDRDLEQIAHRLRQVPRVLRRNNRIGLDRIASGLCGDAVPIF